MLYSHRLQALQPPSILMKLSSQHESIKTSNRTFNCECVYVCKCVCVRKSSWVGIEAYFFCISTNNIVATQAFKKSVCICLCFSASACVFSICDILKASFFCLFFTFPTSLCHYSIDSHLCIFL